MGGDDSPKLGGRASTDRALRIAANEEAVIMLNPACVESGTMSTDVPKPSARPHEAWQILGSPAHPAPLPPAAFRKEPPPGCISVDVSQALSTNALYDSDEVQRCQENLEKLNVQRQEFKRQIKDWLHQLERLHRHELHILHRHNSHRDHHPSDSRPESRLTARRPSFHSVEGRDSCLSFVGDLGAAHGRKDRASLSASHHLHGHGHPQGHRSHSSHHSRKQHSYEFVGVDEPLNMPFGQAADRPSIFEPIADPSPKTKEAASSPNVARSSMSIRFDLQEEASKKPALISWAEPTTRETVDETEEGEVKRRTSSSGQAADATPSAKLFKKVQPQAEKSLITDSVSYLGVRSSGHQWQMNLKRRSHNRTMAVLNWAIGGEMDDDYADGEYMKLRHTWPWRVTHSTTFQAMTAGVIILNGILLGIHAELDLQAVIHNDERPNWLQMEICFAVYFTLELFCRIFAERMLFFIGQERTFNIMDVLLVVLGIIDVSTYGLPNLTYLRLLRFIRLLRLARVVRAVHSFRIIVYAIVGSFTSLTWCFIVVGFIIYMFSIFFVHGVTLHFEDHPLAAPTEVVDNITGCPGSSDPDYLRDHFGSVTQTMITLWMSISGGLDWQIAVEPLKEVHWVYEPLYNLYVFFMCLGVLNVVVGWFVATTSDIAQKDREAFINSEMTRLDQYSRKLRTFFQEADVDRSGMLSWEEFKRHLLDDRVKAYFHGLELDVSQASTLFRLLDVDCNNAVSFEEFLSGCMRLKGQARSIDVNMLIYETNRVFKKLEGFFDEWHLYTDHLREDSPRSGSSSESIFHDSLESQQEV